MKRKKLIGKALLSCLGGSLEKQVRQAADFGGLKPWRLMVDAGHSRHWCDFVVSLATFLHKHGSLAEGPLPLISAGDLAWLRSRLMRGHWAYHAGYQVAEYIAKRKAKAEAIRAYKAKTERYNPPARDGVGPPTA